MKICYLMVLVISSLLVMATGGRCQGPQENRLPAVAGTFYPSDRKELTKALSELFSHAVHRKNLTNVVAIIAPHAGYDYSGVVAASSFSQVDPSRKYDNIFILGPSHYVGFDGASV